MTAVQSWGNGSKKHDEITARDSRTIRTRSQLRRAVRHGLRSELERGDLALIDWLAATCTATAARIDLIYLKGRRMTDYRAGEVPRGPDR